MGPNEKNTFSSSPNLFIADQMIVCQDLFIFLSSLYNC